MYRERLDNQVHCAPDSVATTTPPPGRDYNEQNPLGRTPSGHRPNADEGRHHELDTYMRLALSGIHAYLAESGDVQDQAYLAWEDVRKVRAAELVGKVRKPNGEELPYTGFEGYFVGAKPEEIVAREVGLGQLILRSIHNFGKSEPSGITESELRIALHGGKMSPQHISKILEFYDCLFQDALARARGTISPERSEFRIATYQRVTMGQTTIPVEHTNTTVVRLKNQQELEAYEAVENIGAFGHPAMRAVAKIDY